MKKKVGDTRLIVKSCILYYEDNLSQQEIGKILNISRPTVSRILKEAKRLGIVKIQINKDFNSDYEILERCLEKKFGLKEVIIVDDMKDSFSQKLELASATARYLERSLKDDDIVGVSMGTTLKEISRFVECLQPLNITFLPLIGGVGQIGIEIHPNQIVRDLALAFGGDFKFLHAPAVLSNTDIKLNLKKDKGIKEILDEINKVNIAIVGIGVPTNKDSTMMATGYYDEEKIKVLKQKKAAGDICLQFYDAGGRIDQFEFNKNVFGIEINQLRNIQQVIGVAGGKEKVEAILGAINGKYINILVSNYSCCKELLKS